MTDKNFGQGFRYAPLGQEFFNMFQSRLIKYLVFFITFLLCQFLLSVIQNKNVKGRGCYYNICNRAKPGQPQACWEPHIGQRCLLGPANNPESYSHFTWKLWQASLLNTQQTFERSWSQSTDCLKLLAWNLKPEFCNYQICKELLGVRQIECLSKS